MIGNTMTDQANRRDFLKNVGWAGASLAAIHTVSSPAAEVAAKPQAKAVAPPLQKIAKPLMIGLIGAGARGTQVGSGFASLPGAVIKYVCDVDSAHALAAAKAIAQRQGAEPQTVENLRQVLDDPSIDAVVIATPDHWHAPAAIQAIVAGKHVYVEKPCCHNPHEGELLVTAAQKYNRIVQHGSQRRSYPRVREAIERIHAGDIGKVYLSRGWYNNNREATGQRLPAKVPPGLNWDLWQGPAPRRPYTENVVPYKWHWYWNWGTGELGNNGIHSLDVCRWGLGVEFPRKVTAGGGRYHFQDDQETPDTLSVTYDFGDKAIIWEGRSCNRHGFEGSGFGIAFYGDKATMVIDGGEYRLLDVKDKEIERQSGPAGDAPHFQNFIDCTRSGERPAAPIDEAYKSTLLCHLGNIAYRSGGAISCDPKTGHILENPAAEALWHREYEKGWEPKV
jgi:predicted dehydrogenase